MSKNTMSLSSDEQVQNSYDFLNSMEKPACPTCVRGVRMCYHTPCIGTVEDMEKLIDAGYARNLMLDWWVGEDHKAESISKSFGLSKPTRQSKPKKGDNPFTEDVSYLLPAIVGLEAQQAPFTRSGKCNLLVDNKCSLHDKGLKPTQGQYACCTRNRVFLDSEGNEQDIDERILILHTWNTQRGKDLIERWKKEVGLVEEKEHGLPDNPVAMFEALLNVMISHSKLYTEEGEDGRPAIDPNEVKVVTKTVHVLPV